MLAKWAALGFSVLILGNAFLVRRHVGTWNFPAALFSLFWFGYSFLPLAMLYRLPVDPWGMVYLLVQSLAFSASALVLPQWRHAFEENRFKPSASTIYDTPFLRLVLLVASGAALALFVVNMRIQGFSAADMLTQTVETAATYAALRNSNDLTLNWAARAGMAFAYLAAAVGGLVCGSSRLARRRAIALAAAFLPAIASLLLESAKGLLFQFVSLFFGALLVTRLFDGHLTLMDRRGMRKAVIAGAVVLVLTAISFKSRGLYGVEDNDLIAAELPRYFGSYAFGHLYAFSDWFAFRVGQPASLAYPQEPVGYGFYTFAPLFKVFGSQRTMVSGVFDDYFLGGEIITTNVFTMFRGLIIDFGVVGSVLYTFVTGLLVHWAFYVMLVTRRPVATVAIFIYVIGYFYSSAFVSLFMYNVIPSSIAVLSLVLFVNARVRWPWEGLGRDRLWRKPRLDFPLDRADVS